MQDKIPDALIAAFERHYAFPWDEPTLRNERLAWRAAWAEATKPCLLQIQEPSSAEQAAWHAGLDEGRTQAAQHAAVDVPASGSAALNEYLKDCEQHSIVPDVGGAFAHAFAAGSNLAATQEAGEGDYIEGVNIPNLREALIFLGRENGVGEGEVGDKLAQYVNSVVSGVLSKKATLRSAPQAAPAAVAVRGSREERMIVLQRGKDGIPTVWCDPEIADIVGALNSGGVRTVASCSGHGEKPGGIALADGRQLLLLNSLDAFNSAISTLCQSAPAPAPAAVAVPDGWKLVPVVPTLSMGWAYLDKAREVSPDSEWVFSQPGYEAALSAAPQPPALAATSAADTKPFLSEDDLDDLRRFEGMASDGESYDIAKKRMKRLAELGVVRWAGGSRYCMTAFGQYVLKCWDHLPLETHKEANARVSAEFKARIDRLNAEAVAALQGGEA